MKILVGYDGGQESKMALSMARDMAKLHHGFVYVVISMEGGASEKRADIEMAEQNLVFARQLMQTSEVECDCQQSVRGLSPGEDLVLFAQENLIDHIFIGLRNKTRIRKTILGSTANTVILKAPCPVTTVKFDINTITCDALLKDKRILVVDDEPDILETIEELLDMCFLDTADCFDTAKKLIENSQYDLAILDIMGVNGYEILGLAKKQGIPALMLTAHALTPENLKESIRKGAHSYIPKDELANLADHTADVFKAELQGKTGYGAWFPKLKPFFDKSFGAGWQDKDKPFWNSFNDKYGG